MSGLSRRSLVAASTASLALPALAQAPWPNGSIRIVAPFPPGGSTDALARLLQMHLSQALGVPVVVENRAGALGSLGTAAVARAAPDGNTWIVVSDNHGANPAVLPNLPYDTERDITHLLLIGTAPMVLTTPRAQP